MMRIDTGLRQTWRKLVEEYRVVSPCSTSRFDDIVADVPPPPAGDHRLSARALWVPRELV